MLMLVIKMFSVLVLVLFFVILFRILSLNGILWVLFI